MHELYQLKEMLMNELKEYGRKGELTSGSLDVVDKLSHAIKNICKIVEAYEEEDGNSSYRYAGGEGEQSRARGRGRNARRDSMGRYSSRYDGGGSNRYDGGGSSYAEGVEDMVDSIRSMMQELPENIKHDAQRFVQKLEQEMR